MMRLGFVAACTVLVSGGSAAAAGGAAAVMTDREELRTLGDIRPARAPDFVLRGLDGQLFTLSDSDARAVILVFFNRRCDTCDKELSMLEQVHQRWTVHGLRVVGVETDRDASERLTQASINKLKLTFPVAVDRDGAVCNLYNPGRDAPFAVVVVDGTVAAYKRRGFQAQRPSEIEAEVERLVADHATAAAL